MISQLSLSLASFTYSGTLSYSSLQSVIPNEYLRPDKGGHTKGHLTKGVMRDIAGMGRATPPLRA